jgi:uncharacterized protein
MNLLFNASNIPSALMFAALNEQDFLCRVFGKCLAGDQLDREVGDMIGSAGALKHGGKLFTYVRYNAELTEAGLTAIGCGDINPQSDCSHAIGKAIRARKYHRSCIVRGMRVGSDWP